MQSYPIWHNVSSCHYKSDKSFGGKANSAISVYVGQGASNSLPFVNHVVTKRAYDHPKYGPVVEFQFRVEGVVLKAALFHAKDKKRAREVAGELIGTKSHLKRIKGLVDPWK